MQDTCLNPMPKSCFPMELRLIFLPMMSIWQCQPKQKWHSRMAYLPESIVEKVLQELKPIFNLEANHTNDNEYGFVIYPK